MFCESGLLTLDVLTVRLDNRIDAPAKVGNLPRGLAEPRLHPLLAFKESQRGLPTAPYSDASYEATRVYEADVIKGSTLRLEANGDRTQLSYRS